MDGKKNIGLVTWFGTPNFGTNLQAYALYKELEERGFNVKIIKRFKTPFTLKNIKDNFFYAHGIRRFWKYHPDPTPLKTRKIRRFIQSEMDIAQVYTGHDLKKLLEWGDLFVAGSDQLWNGYDHFRGFEFLDFAAGKPKISYATSIGAQDIPEEHREKVKDYLAEFKKISLRERSGASSISRITGRSDIATVLDPVLLRPQAFWDQVADKAASASEKPGILYYILKKTTAGELPLYPGQRALVVPSGENPDLAVPGATVIPDAGIPEFVALVRNADLVVTDSFHGTALSILFSRPFVNLNRFREEDAASQNVRLRDLLDSLGIPDRTWQGEALPPIDYTAVQARLEALRAESASFLDKALSDHA